MTRIVGCGVNEEAAELAVQVTQNFEEWGE